MALVIKTVRDELRSVAAKAQTLMATAQTEDRLLTDAERAEIDELVAQAGKLEATVKKADEQGALAERFRSMMSAAANGGRAPEPTAPANNLVIPVGYAGGVVKSLGQQFVESAAYQEFRSQSRGGRWETRPVEVFAATTSTPTGGILPGLTLPPFLLFRWVAMKVLTHCGIEER